MLVWVVEWAVFTADLFTTEYELLTVELVIRPNHTMYTIINFTGVASETLTNSCIIFANQCEYNQKLAFLAHQQTLLVYYK